MNTFISITSLQVQEFNDLEAETDEPYNEDEEVPEFFKYLSASDQARLLYTPPFLNKSEINKRRFGDDPSDRWWEWE